MAVANTQPFHATTRGKSMARPPVGVIINPRSRRNRRGTTAFKFEARSDVHLAAPITKGELDEAVAEFARRDVGTVVIAGGDGTVRDVLSALPSAFGEAHPAIALMPSGGTNLIARNTGGIPASADGLERFLCLLSTGGALREARQQCLDVTWPAEPGRFVRGTIFGAAAYARGTELARQTLRGGSASQTPGLPLAVTAMLWRMMVGSERRQLREGEPIAVKVDDGDEIAGNRFLVVVTPLRRLMFGLWPFAETGDGPLHWLDVDAPQNRMLRLSAEILLKKRFGENSTMGHRSGKAETLRIATPAPFVMDGDMFTAANGAIRLSASPPLRFLSL